MISEALTEPGPGGICRVCDTQLDPGSLRCRVCGAVYGESNRCPHCRAVADVEGAGLPGRCRVCGGPRIRVDDTTVIRSGREIPVLLRAQRARRAARALDVGAVGAAAVAASVLVALVTAAVTASPSAGVLLLGSVLVLATTTFAAALARRARVERRASASAVEEAKLLVASDVVRSHGGRLDAPLLARALRVDEREAELLAAELALNDYLAARVDDAGTLALTPGRVRVTAPLDATALEPTAAFEAPSERQARSSSR